MTTEQDRFWKALEPEYDKGMIFCRKLMGDRDRGDDLYQDALVIACSKFGHLREPAAFRSWLYRVIISTFQSTVRRPWWKREVAWTPENEAQLQTPDPANRYQARRWLSRAFEAVSAKDQALVVLHELEGWSLNELARLEGRSEGAIKLQLFRARQKMRRVLEKQIRKAKSREMKMTFESETQGCVAAKSETE